MAVVGPSGGTREKRLATFVEVGEAEPEPSAAPFRRAEHLVTPSKMLTLVYARKTKYEFENATTGCRTEHFLKKITDLPPLTSSVEVDGFSRSPAAREVRRAPVRTLRFLSFLML